VVLTSTLLSSSGPLTDPGLDLSAPPVDVPLELRIPSLQINSPVLAVGITSENVMDAPQGSAQDPVWQTAFWYRGGGIPGDVGTATIAGHVAGIRGRPALFAHLKDLRPGDLITIHDTRSGLGVHFIVTEMETYSLQEASDPSVLAQIYGSGPVSGKGPQPAPDGLSHLTLITCSGSFVQGSYDHRLVVYAERVQAMPQEYTAESGPAARVRSAKQTCRAEIARTMTTWRMWLSTSEHYLNQFRPRGLGLLAETSELLK